MSPLQLVMDFLPPQGSAMDLVSCALICFSETDLETESEKLSFVSAKFRAMEWVSLSSSGVCGLESATARKLF